MSIRQFIITISLPLRLINEVIWDKVAYELGRKEMWLVILSIIYGVFEVKLGFVYGLEVNEAEGRYLEFLRPLLL